MQRSNLDLEPAQCCPPFDLSRDASAMGLVAFECRFQCARDRQCPWNFAVKISDFSWSWYLKVPPETLSIIMDVWNGLKKT